MKRMAALSLPACLPLLLAPVAHAVLFSTSNEMAREDFSESLNAMDRTISANGLLVTATITTAFSAAWSEWQCVRIQNGVPKRVEHLVGTIPGLAPGTYHETHSATGIGVTFRGHEDRTAQSVWPAS
jgi:hypothetical protein